jgi:CBS domain-containing protein
MNKEKFIEFTANQNISLNEAMILIENNQHRSLIVVNDKNVVVGTISDGDIRKALLGGRLLITKIKDLMNLNFISLREYNKSKAKKIFEETHIFLIPVLDNDGKLVDIIDSYGLNK